MSDDEDRLVRDLSFSSVYTITIGAMLGAGIFILPGIAISNAGQGALLSYLFAALVAFTAALSVSELATAMPKSGGSYHFLSRAMGPIAGSMAGIGSWAALTLKGSFALIGFAFYLALFIPGLPSKLVAITLCIVLTGVNTMGTKRAGDFQRIMVIIVIIALSFLLIVGLPQADISGRPTASDVGAPAIFATSGLVFVSFIGVVNVSAVAEEISEPEKNIPRGIAAALVTVTVLYLLLVYLIAGVLDTDLAHAETPVADAGRVVLGEPGFYMLAGLGCLATLSMTNAAIMASARYPYAMSSDNLMSEWMLVVHERYKTPYRAVIITGAIMVTMIALLDVEALAELASVFNLLIFALLNVAVIVMRLSRPDWYEPRFRSPGYPAVQVLGVAGALIIGFQLNLISQMIAGSFIIVGAAWYYGYGHGKTTLRGLLREAVRQPVRGTSVRQVEERVMEEDHIHIIHPIVNPHHEKDILHVASLLQRPGKTSLVHIVRLKEFPFQTPVTVKKPGVEGMDTPVEDRLTCFANEQCVEVEFTEYITHDRCQALMELTREMNADLILMDWAGDFTHHQMHKSDIDWVLQHAPCDVVVLRDMVALTDLKSILVTTPLDTFDPLAVDLADRLGVSHDADVKLMRVLSRKVSDDEMASKEAYLRNIADVMESRTSVEVVRAHSDVEHIIAQSDNYDLVVIDVAPDFHLRDWVFGRKIDRIAFDATSSVMVVMQRKDWSERMSARALHAIAGKDIVPECQPESGSKDEC